MSTQLTAFQKFALPTKADEIKWRVQETKAIMKNGKKMTPRELKEEYKKNIKIYDEVIKYQSIVVPYINKTAVINRLIDCFGFGNFQTDFTQESYQNNGKFYTGFKGKIGVWDEVKKQWFWVSDGADATNIESFKGGISGAYKRAAGHLGFGLDLNRYPTCMIVQRSYSQIEDYAMGELNKLTKKVEAGQEVKEDFKYIDVTKKGKPVLEEHQLNAMIEQIKKDNAIAVFKKINSYNVKPSQIIDLANAMA